MNKSPQHDGGEEKFEPLFSPFLPHSLKKKIRHLTPFAPTHTAASRRRSGRVLTGNVGSKFVKDLQFLPPLPFPSSALSAGGELNFSGPILNLVL